MKHLKWLFTLCIVLGLVVLFAVTAAAGSKGDLDSDGQITASDARGALRIAVGLDECAPNSNLFHFADIDTDDMITASDARIILRVAVGLELHEENMLIMAITNDYTILFDKIYYEDGEVWYEMLLQNKTGSTIEFDFYRDNANGCMLGSYTEYIRLDPYDTVRLQAIPFDTEDAAPDDLSLERICYIRIPYDVFTVDPKTYEHTAWLGGDDISVSNSNLLSSYYYKPSYKDSDYNHADDNIRFVYYGSGSFYGQYYDYYKLRLFAQNTAGQDLFFVITPTAVNGIALNEDEMAYNECYTEIYKDHCGFFDLVLERWYEDTYSVLDEYGINPDDIYALEFDISVYTFDGQLLYTESWHLN